MIEFWSALAHKFRRRNEPGAQLDLADAYQAVFMGPSATREQREIVLSDLGAYTAFFTFADKKISDPELRYREGARSVFGHIYGQLTMTPSQREALQMAIRNDQAAIAQAEAEEEFA